MELMSGSICSQFAQISWTEERENAGPFLTSESCQSACHLSTAVRMTLALGPASSWEVEVEQLQVGMT